MREATEFYKIDLEEEWVEYYLTDITKSLKGKDVKVYLRWEQMTTIGPYYKGAELVGAFKMPDAFHKEQRMRGHAPGPKNRKDNY